MYGQSPRFALVLEPAFRWCRGFRQTHGVLIRGISGTGKRESHATLVTRTKRGGAYVAFAHPMKRGNGLVQRQVALLCHLGRRHSLRMKHERGFANILPTFFLRPAGTGWHNTNKVGEV